MWIFHAYHPHFGEINKTLLSKIWSSFLNEGQVCQIHSQVWHTWRVAAGQQAFENNTIQVRHLHTPIINMNFMIILDFYFCI